MNMTMRQRSALVQAAEHKHNQLPRPVLAGEIVMAEYNPKPAFKYGRIVLVALVLVAVWGAFA